MPVENNKHIFLEWSILKLLATLLTLKVSFNVKIKNSPNSPFIMQGIFGNNRFLLHEDNISILVVLQTLTVLVFELVIF